VTEVLFIPGAVGGSLSGATPRPLMEESGHRMLLESPTLANYTLYIENTSYAEN
jgi:hypothetical protein